MALRFRNVTVKGLGQLSAEVPPGAVVGLVGEDAAAIQAILELAGGVCVPSKGEVEGGPKRYGAPGVPLPDAAGVLTLPFLFSATAWTERVRQRAQIERLRRQGTTILLSSFEPELLTALCDELWWIDGGKIAMRGAPREVLAASQRAALESLRVWASQQKIELSPSLRRGDGRAELIAVETLDAAGQPTVAWQSGQDVGVRVRVRYAAAVDDPVVGIMIRTRIGFEVFGTNTELEQVALGPCAAGDERSVLFRFTCALCPQEYTLTAASHDRDGVWHDWMEDAVAFTVADTRYTAGVANLRAKVEIEGR
ncbi:MAG: Wzt carbohydrate-binding domain-containing protein [Acidobacteriota bacterium]